VTNLARWAERELDYKFSDLELLAQALTHRSASRQNYERLEFLGDAMLSLTVARELYESRPQASEGDLSRARAALVNKQALAGIARRIGVDGLLVLGAGEARSGGAQRASALADAFEAMIGAVVLDGGYDAGDRVVRRLIAETLDALPDADALKDPKTKLQEWLQGRGLGLPAYTVDEASGSDHNLLFVVSCSVDAKHMRATGRGSSRRRAEQAAAEAMLIELKGGER
jgi:ribonuclease-3